MTTKATKKAAKTSRISFRVTTDLFASTESFARQNGIDVSDVGRIALSRMVPRLVSGQEPLLVETESK